MVKAGPPRSPWPLVGLLYLTGLLAAAQLGKLSALAPLIAAELHLGLTTVALAISLLEVGGATLGAAAGQLAQRLGLRRSLRWGLAALALGGLGGAAAQGAAGLLGWRLLEAAGYLGVIVTAPVLIAHYSAHHSGHLGDRFGDHRGAHGPAARSAAQARASRLQQGLALALWSTFVPVGLALGAWASAGLAQPALAAGPGLGWRGAMAVGAAVAGLLWLVVWRAPLPALTEPPATGSVPAPSPSPSPSPSTSTSTSPLPLPLPLPSTSPLPAGPEAGSALAGSGAAADAVVPGQAAAVRCLALAFGGFALFDVGLLGLLPTLLVQDAGLTPAEAGRWTALASVSAVPGSAAAALLLRLGARLRMAVMLSLGLPALLLFGVFTPAPQAGTVIALAIAINLLGGVFAGLAFALLPVVAGSHGHMVRANGLLAQCGASGSLLGPPLMAACAQAAGWTGAALLGLAVTLLALPLAWRAVGWAASAGVHGPGAAEQRAQAGRI